MTNRLPLFLILVFPLFVCFMAWYVWYSPATTVILVRHAERLNDTDTTSISEAGLERAEQLAHTLHSYPLKRIFVSEKHRTLQTATATASLFNIRPSHIAANNIRGFADSVKAQRGDAILIVGHSDTVPKIIAKLGISSPPAIDTSDFDDIFVVTVFRFRSTMVHLKYGPPS
ncbi:MAG: histidine phosphatase family protein [Bacteroidetes bacterium]|nr:histidine phosphatase family protein [Bacteroidota bacterium]MCW5897310.1 histidine phosphatase family protein [Bacteroidota bacterium]